MKFINSTLYIRNMETLTLDNMDKHFSSELLALMGEWFTVFQVGKENGLALDEVPTIRDFFETGRISAHGAFSDEVIIYGPPSGKKSVYLKSLLESYEIIGDFHDDIQNYSYLKPIVGYDDVKNTFRENLSSGKKAIFPCFVWFSKGFLPQTEYVSFSCDIGCHPLIEAFCTEGYMGRRGETFHWTPLIRVMMEILGYWKTEHDLDAKAKKTEEARQRISILDRLYEAAFEESLDDEDLTPLINFIKKYPTVMSFTASQELEHLGIASAIPVIGIIMLLGNFGLDINPDTVVQDLSEAGEAVKTLRRSEFEKVIEVFWPKRIDPEARRDEPSKTYKLPWLGDSV